MGRICHAPISLYTEAGWTFAGTRATIVPDTYLFGINSALRKPVFRRAVRRLGRAGRRRALAGYGKSKSRAPP